MNGKPLHIVLTRAGLTVTAESWYRNAVVLLDAVTIPSLTGQSDSNFLWFLAVDSRAPSWFQDWLRCRVASNENFLVVPIKLENVARCRLGGFDWVFDEACKAANVERYLNAVDDFIISSNIDFDDAWASFVIERIGQHFQSRLIGMREAESVRSYLLRPSGGSLATFTDGVRFDVNTNRCKNEVTECASMSVFVCSRFSSGISAASCRHRGWIAYKDVLDFEYCKLKTAEPAWLYVRHGGAMSNAQLAGDKFYYPDNTFLRQFGITVDKVAKLAAIDEMDPANLEDDAGYRLQELFTSSTSRWLKRL